MVKCWLKAVVGKKIRTIYKVWIEIYTFNFIIPNFRRKSGLFGTTF